MKKSITERQLGLFYMPGIPCMWEFPHTSLPQSLLGPIHAEA